MRMNESGREEENERVCVSLEILNFILRFGSSKILLVLKVFLDEMIVIVIIIMCCLNKIKTWHPCLFFQLIFLYLSVKS